MRAVVFANGELPPAAFVRSVVAGADLVVAADGGAEKALAAGVEVEAVIGDLDSLGEAARGRLGEARLHRDSDPETTDLQKAVAYVLAKGATRVDILAGGGGRADHALANFSVVTAMRGRADVRLQDEQFEVSAVNGEATIEGEPGAVVSLVAIGPCEGVTTRGLRWDLEGARLDFSPRGVHNELVGRVATVRVARGDLLLFRGRWVEVHGRGDGQ